MNAWVTPFIVRIGHADWVLADAVAARFGLQTVYGRYVRDGRTDPTYELFCVVPGEKMPDDRMGLIDEIQRFAFAHLEAHPVN